MIALIVSGGQIDLEQLRQQIRALRKNKGLLIAADRGLEALHWLCQQQDSANMAKDSAKEWGWDDQEEHFLPQVAVGDFDSVDPQVFQQFWQHPEIRFERHRPEKNETDTELAFTIAKEAGATEIILMGATGTRLDHVLSNIHLLKAAKDRGLSCQLLDLHNRIRLTDGMVSFTKEENWPFVSLVPLTMEVKGITLTGFKYPLTEHHLALGEECGLCISNELVASQGTLECKDGLLLVIEARD